MKLPVDSRSSLIGRWPVNTTIGSQLTVTAPSSAEGGAGPR
jgi:hypothetical protein